MATKFYLAGEEVPNILGATFKVVGRADKFTRRPAGPTRPGQISVTKRSDDNSVFFEWASKSDRNSRKAGEVIFINEDDDQVTTVKFSGAFVAEYRERVPNLELDAGSAPEEKVVISAERMDVEGNEIVSTDWN